MSKAGVKRTTVSLPPDVAKEARKRMKSLKYRKFSQYVSSLIEQDVAKGGSHIIERKPE